MLYRVLNWQGEYIYIYMHVVRYGTTGVADAHTTSHCQHIAATCLRILLRWPLYHQTRLPCCWGAPIVPSAAVVGQQSWLLCGWQISFFPCHSALYVTQMCTILLLSPTLAWCTRRTHAQVDVCPYLDSSFLGLFVLGQHQTCRPLNQSVTPSEFFLDQFCYFRVRWYST